MLFLGRAVLICISLVLVTAGWPRFLAGLGELETGSVYRNNKQEIHVAGAIRDHALLSLGRSSDLNPTSSLYYAQSADLYLRKAMRLESKGEFGSARAEFDNSRLHAKEGLVRGPSDPYAWFVLAYTEQAIDGPSEAALTALSTSFAISMTEGNLLVPRISWCFGHWSILPENLKKQAKGQIQLALRNNNIRRSLAQYAASLPPVSQDSFLKIVEDVGSAEPDNLPKFRYWLRVSMSSRNAR